LLLIKITEEKKDICRTKNQTKNGLEINIAKIIPKIAEITIWKQFLFILS